MYRKHHVIILICIYLILLISMSACRVTADKCVSLETCIRIAFARSSKLLAARHLRESERLKLAASRKGLGFRTDLAVSLKRQDQDFNYEDAQLSGVETQYQHNELLNIRQTFPWGTTFNLYLDNNLTESDNEVFDQQTGNPLNYGISIQQDLFVLSLLQLDIQMAEARLKGSEASLKVVERQVIFEVGEAYYNYLRALQIRNARLKALQIARRLTDLSTRQFEKGVSIDVDLLEARVSLSLAEANLQQAVMDIETGRNNLSQALGLETYEFDICPVNERKHVPIPEKATLEALLTQNPRLEALKSQIAQLKVEYQREKRDFDKSIKFEANYERNAYGRSFEKVYRNDQYDQIWFVGMTFNIPLWDNGVNQNNIDAIDYQVKNLSATINDAHQSLIVDLENTLNALTRLNTIMSTLSQANQYAEKNLELMNAKFSRGLNNVYDVVRAEQNLTNTRLSLINSIIDYNINIIQLYSLTGCEGLSPYLEEG
ncbi:MAG: TolC family protein [Deltaproteobacteria bacterium]|nr:TolC family protein [Deltaproteobacteria bacterium]